MSEPTAGHEPLGAKPTRSANRAWWDAEAADYYLDHGEFLGDAELVWGPEGWAESQLCLLGSLDGVRALEIGAGAAQGSRYAARCGAQCVASDLSAGMLRQGRQIDRRREEHLPLVQCDATCLPFADQSFDLVFTAYGAVPFVADSAELMVQAHRVLRPGGRFVFATTHPVRWSFPDEPGREGLRATRPYFDRTPYVERSDGKPTYAEHHRTLGDRVREIVAAGLRLLDLVEPEWPEDNQQVWGGWSPTRGEIIPGTAIFVCERPAAAH
ncbi:class I SAM-dependent methyltransferase [Leekyejoonella antrihumi]|uniref:Class I SAM-dependent methyltransferase n=1 Tax=Leekyejoonella antrihumi TaxID=1660198 RepID=A0A563E3N9_9MICO|nr:class I SAM-dependent methyltransferase [Leekyejoonella antrihumi]TWP37140.1 class I SAM-dependent methyltransferase [Leekyejoonella antrihumi]